MNKQLETIEQEIVQLEKEAKQKEEALASPDVYEDTKKMESATKAFALAKEKLAQKQAEWDNLAVEIDKY
jgi:cytochrome c556